MYSYYMELSNTKQGENKMAQTISELLARSEAVKEDIKSFNQETINKENAKAHKETKPREIQAKNLKPFRHIIVDHLENTETDRWTGLVINSSWSDEKGLDVGYIQTPNRESETMAHGTYWVVNARDEDYEAYKAMTAK